MRVLRIGTFPDSGAAESKRQKREASEPTPSHFDMDSAEMHSVFDMDSTEMHSVFDMYAPHKDSVFLPKAYEEGEAAYKLGHKVGKLIESVRDAHHITEDPQQLLSLGAVREWNVPAGAEKYKARVDDMLGFLSYVNESARTPVVVWSTFRTLLSKLAGPARGMGAQDEEVAADAIEARTVLDQVARSSGFVPNDQGLYVFDIDKMTPRVRLPNESEREIYKLSD